MNREIVITEANKNQSAKILKTVSENKDQIKSMKRTRLIDGLRFIVRGNMILV